MQASVNRSNDIHPSLPPGPKGWPFVGNALQFSHDPLGYLRSAAQTYGDVVQLHMGSMPVVLISHPDQIEEVLVSKKHNFIKEPIEKLQHTFDAALFGNGLLTSDGDFWLRQRRLAQPAFHRHRIASYSTMMIEHTERMLARWRDGETRDVHEDMMRLTLEIVAQTLFSADVTGDAADVGTALDVVMRVSAETLGSPMQIPTYIPTPRNRRFMAAIRQLESVITKIIRQRRASDEDTGDLLSMLLHTQDEDGSRMTDQQLRDELVTMFVAGHETTALALSWTWYLLTQSPEVEAQLLEELQTVLQGRTPTMADLPQLRYTDMVLKESMRIYPPAWLLSGRVAVADCTLGGYQIPAGTLLAISSWVTHHDARFFSEPDRFNPQRWNTEDEQQRPKFAYFPFGGGPRMCIGQAFAMMEATLILTTIAQRFQLTLVPGQTIEPQPSITIRPKYGLKMRLTKR